MPASTRAEKALHVFDGDGQIVVRGLGDVAWAQQVDAVLRAVYGGDHPGHTDYPTLLAVQK
ncbi:hypothetical protein ACFY0B_39350 [Streptomyces sp. NPDC001797]|uniref:hypothetical protein n=1 Tax=Streptomyces sp. NPDC001797 TaxID=3364610 RepID=UPI00369D4854